MGGVVGPWGNLRGAPGGILWSLRGRWEGPTLGLPCQQATPWISLLQDYWAYLGSTLPTSKSLDIIALGLLGLPWPYLAKKQLLGYHCSGPTWPTLGPLSQRARPWISLLCAHWAYLGPTFPTSKSVDVIALGLPWAFLEPTWPTTSLEHFQNSIYVDDVLLNFVYKPITLDHF